MNSQQPTASSAFPSPSSGEVPERYAHIVGWGADLDPKDRPAVPMERTPPRLPGKPVAVPEQQEVHVKVFHSTERPGITPIFGSPNPPSGVSGAMRALAFKLSENDIRHWLLLLAADRVNMVEGLVDDLTRGVMPNILGEMGIRSAWKYDRGGVIRKALVASAVAGAAVYFLTKKKPRRERRVR